MPISQAEAILHRQIEIVARDGGRSAFAEESGQAVMWQILMAGAMLSDSKSIASIKLDGFPLLGKKDANGNILSKGELTEVIHYVSMKSLGSSMPIGHIDAKSLLQTGGFADVVAGQNSATQESIYYAGSGLLRGLTTGTFEVMNNAGTWEEISPMLTYGDEVPAPATRTSGLWYKNSTNYAPNRGSAEFSADAFIAALAALRQQKTLYGTTIPFSRVYLIVSRAKYDEVKELVMNDQFGTDLMKRQIKGLTVGYFEAEDDRDWILVTDKAQMGFAFFPGYMVPSTEIISDPVTKNLQLITHWYMNAYCASPTGFYINKF